MAKRINGSKVKDPEHRKLLKDAAEHFAKDERKEKRTACPVGKSRNPRADAFMRTGK